MGNRHPIGVLVFEPRECVGAGSAYDDDLETNLLNVTLSSMSAAGDDKLHFTRWLQAQDVCEFRGRPIQPTSFLSRPLFGRYLRALYRDTVDAAARIGVDVRHVREEAVDLAPRRDGYAVRTAGGAEYDVRQAVLAVGNLPSNTFTAFYGKPGYFHSPYPTLTLADGVPKDASVCVVGTSLSAVDALVALADRDHRGAILCVSRNGRLPSVRGLHNRPIALRQGFRTRARDGAERGETMPLDLMIEWLRREFAEHGGDPAEIARTLGPPGDAEAFLEAEIALATAGPRSLQSFGNALNEIIDSLWRMLGASDRRRFEREIKPIWMARRVTFPLENARVLLDLMRAGQLRITDGFSGVTTAAGGGFLVRYASGERGVATEWRADCLVNATSFSCDADASDMPLLRAMLARGTAAADPFGGLHLEAATGGLLGPDGARRPGIGVLGSMAAGTYFWTNAMEVNARLAMDQARRTALRMLDPANR